jgi:K+-sensing histidine kinase KdpD
MNAKLFNILEINTKDKKIILSHKGYKDNVYFVIVASIFLLLFILPMIFSSIILDMLNFSKYSIIAIVLFGIVLAYVFVSAWINFCSEILIVLNHEEILMEKKYLFIFKRQLAYDILDIMQNVTLLISRTNIESHNKITSRTNYFVIIKTNNKKISDIHLTEGCNDKQYATSLQDDISKITGLNKQVKKERNSFAI